MVLYGLFENRTLRKTEVDVLLERIATPRPNTYWTINFRTWLTCIPLELLFITFSMEERSFLLRSELRT
jgi:hypothetical protein